MYRHILIATDGSELAGKAVTQGLALARQVSAKVTAVYVTEPWTAFVGGELGFAIPIEGYERACDENAARILSAVGEQARSLKVACETLHVKDRLPADGIVETATARGCDLVAMASHGRRGVARLLLGSQAQQVLVHSNVPVLICR